MPNYLLSVYKISHRQSVHETHYMFRELHNNDLIKKVRLTLSGLIHVINSALCAKTSLRLNNSILVL